MLRILKAGFRYGDSSPMADIEFLNRDKDAKGFKDRQRTKELKNIKSEKPVSENDDSSSDVLKIEEEKKENKDKTK